LFIPRRSSRIQERCINNTPNRRDISNVDRCTKIHASVQSDIQNDDGRSTSTSTLPPTENTDDAKPSNPQQEKREQNDPANGHHGDSEQSRQNNVGHDGDNEAEMVRLSLAATDENEQHSEQEAQQLQDITITA